MTDQPIPRPSSREVADLLAEYRAMLDDAGGAAGRIPPERSAAWQARKRDLLDRIHAHTARGDSDADAGRGCSR